MTVLIVDYGVGNLASVGRAFKKLGVDYRLSRDPCELGDAERLVLPGVGHFGESMTNLRALGLEDALRGAIASGAKLLGICVGFQMLFEGSEEAPGIPGLGLLKGEVHRFGESLLVPHIGWNQLEEIRKVPLLEGVSEGDYFYFLHSYCVRPHDDEEAWAFTDYGGRFCSVAGEAAVAGIQFHPEKSQELGLRVLANFCEGS